MLFERPTTCHIFASLCAASGAILTGCNEDKSVAYLRADTPGWVRVSVGDALVTAGDQRAIARDARQALATSLMTELASALNSGGPEPGIQVCAERAPRIAETVSESHGVKIGRTSFRLRNPENSPPDWATNAIAQRIDVPIAFVHDDGRLAVLEPIRVAENCLMCHGTTEQLAPGVPGALAARYPNDEATGFATGDLRGWFWIEVPSTHEQGDGDD